MLTFHKQHGFTLLEALIAFLLLAIIVLGSGTILNWMLKSQNNTYINSIVVNEMQKRLQKVNSTTTDTSPTECSYVNQSSFIISGTTFYMACSVKSSTVPDSTVTIKWPVMAASPNTQDEATNCANAIVANTSPAADCYVIGN